MHKIEPHFRWRDLYVASEDRKSPFFRRTYSEFEYTHRVYNYYIHPQWDEFGSSTLYLKILFADYDEGYALLELIGEWNDTLHDDIKELKRNVADPLMNKGIFKFVFFADNLLNFHAGDRDYYEEWAEEVREEHGWIVVVNTRKHVDEEMASGRLQFYLNFGGDFNDINWRPHKPQLVFQMIEGLLNGQIRRLGD